MKICHNVKFTDEEKVALYKVKGILTQLANDSMFSIIFGNEYGAEISHVSYWFDSLMDFISGFEEEKIK